LYLSLQIFDYWRVGLRWDIFPEKLWLNRTVPYLISPLYGMHEIIILTILIPIYLHCYYIDYIMLGIIIINWPQRRYAIYVITWSVELSKPFLFWYRDNSLLSYRCRNRTPDSDIPSHQDDQLSDLHQIRAVDR